ncbi:MAG: CoA-binding protein [Chloroflexota bacterium]|nr:CoA-binding protein [Chloroflexota bacterium]
MQNLIQDFLAQRRIAIVGVTRDKQGWGRTLYDEFKKRGYDVYAVNPTGSLPGIQCYKSLRDLPMKVDGALLSVPPQVTDQVVREVAALGIPRVWMHKGAGGAGAVSEAAIQFCNANHIAAVYGVCPFMYLQPQAFGHKLHHSFVRWFGKLPKGA